MNRHFLLSAVILAAVCCPVGECYAWAPPLYIDSDWTVYAPVGQTVIIDAWVTSGGPVYSWAWSWGGYQDQYDQEYSSMSWGQYDSSGVYSAYVDADSAGGSDDAHSYVYAVAVTQVISSTSATCVGQNVTFGAITNPPNCAPYVSVTWSGGGTPSTGSGSQFTTSWSTGGTKTVTATCGSSSAQKQVTIVQVVGVSATTDVACVGQNVHFAAVTEPPNSAQLVTVTWSGGQNPATGSGSQWTTNWSTPGPKTVIATCGSSSAHKDVTLVEVQIEGFDRVPPTKTKNVQVTVTPSLSGGHTIGLDVIRTAGTTGSATVSPSSITSTTTVTVTGADQSSVGYPDNLSLRARLDAGAECDSEAFTVCAHPAGFEVADCTGLGSQNPNHYGLCAWYEWNSDSGTDGHLDKCKMSEDMSHYYEDSPPFYLGGPPEPSAPFYMDSGKAGDARAVHKDYVHDYTDGWLTYMQDYSWECERCDEIGILSMNDISHHVYDSGSGDYRIVTSVGHSCPGVPCSEDQDIVE